MYRNSNDDWLPFSQRVSMAGAYSEFVTSRIADGYICYYVNFMFNQLPGQRKTQIDIMKNEIRRVHGILSQQVVRNLQSEAWKPLVPWFIGCPDLPVPKRKKVDVDLVRVNDGLHFNGFLFVPPRRRKRGGATVKGAEGRRSKLKIGLIRHFDRKSHFYLTRRLARVHPERVWNDEIRDYPFKTYLSGKISGDDLLVI